MQTVAFSKIPDMLNQLDQNVRQASLTLNVSADGLLSSIYMRSDVDNRSVMDGALSFYEKAIQVNQGGLQTSPGSIAAFKKTEHEVVPSL